MAMKYIRTTWIVSLMIFTWLVVTPIVSWGEDESTVTQDGHVELTVESCAIYGDAYADDEQGWDGYFEEVYACEEAHVFDDLSGSYPCEDTPEATPTWLNYVVEKLHNQVIKIAMQWNEPLRRPLFHLVDDVSPASMVVALHRLVESEDSIALSTPSVEGDFWQLSEVLVEEQDINDLFEQGLTAEEALIEAKRGIIEISSGTSPSEGPFSVWHLIR